jgi:hypothetical protein
MPFDLTDQMVTLNSVTPRTETHGEDRVFAISLGFKLSGPNTLLDRLSAALRPMLYRGDEGQEDIPGVEASTPHLRLPGVEQLNIRGELNGWTLTAQYGIGEPTKIGDCRVDKFRIVPHHEGIVDILFRVGSSDIDATEAGQLCSQLSQEITISLAAPVKQEAPIDGSVAAFERDHPLFDGDGDPPGDDPADETTAFTMSDGQPATLTKRGRKPKPDATSEFIERNKAAAH